MKNGIENKIAQAEASLQRKLDWIGRHDARTAFVTGISVAMLGVLANAAASIQQWECRFYVAFGVATFLLATSLVLIYKSQFPKTESRNFSLAYFGTISELKLDEFKRRFKERSDEEYLEDLLSQIHINAELLKKKFEYLKAALIAMAVSILPWLAALYLSKLYFK